MTALPDAGRQAAVKAVLVPGTTYHFSMATATPGTGGTHEGSSITRGTLKMATPTSTGTEKNATSCTVKVGAKQKLPYVMVWTTATGGTYKWGGANTSSWKTTTVLATTTVTFAIGAITALIS
jgi:hypothetical protein